MGFLSMGSVSGRTSWLKGLLSGVSVGEGFVVEQDEFGLSKTMQSAGAVTLTMEKRVK